MATDHEVFDQVEFWKAFHKDLNAARFRILIECPFLNTSRIRLLEPALRHATKRGVAVCIFIQKKSADKAEESASTPDNERESLIILLKSWGIHVSERTYVHSKVAIIDDDILWDGSLNILCHFDRVSERMNRFVSQQKVRDAIQKQKLYCEQCKKNLSRFAVDQDRSEWVEWGRILKEQREWQNQTQQQIADLCNVDRTVLSKIESGKTGSIKSVAKVSRALGSKLILIPDYLESYIGIALAFATKSKDPLLPNKPK